MFTQKTLRAPLNFAQPENPKITNQNTGTDNTSAQWLLGEHMPLRLRTFWERFLAEITENEESSTGPTGAWVLAFWVAFILNYSSFTRPYLLEVWLALTRNHTIPCLKQPVPGCSCAWTVSSMYFLQSDLYHTCRLPFWARISSFIVTDRSGSNVSEHSRSNQVLCEGEVSVVCWWSLPGQCVRGWCKVSLLQEGPARPGTRLHEVPTNLASFQCKRIHWRVSNTCSRQVCMCSLCVTPNQFKHLP